MSTLRKLKKNNKNMPQLIPFFFLNQIVITFVILFSVIFILSKYVLPSSLLTQVLRTYITKLSKKNV